MSAEGNGILAMGLHDTLRQTRRTARVEDIGQVVGLQFVTALLHLVLMFQPLAHLQELVEIYARKVLRILLHLGVEDDQLLHVRIHLHHTQGNVVLVLLSHEYVADVGIRNHILHLVLTAGGIEGDGDSPYAVGSEVHHHALGFVLRECGNVFLHAHAQFQQGIRHQPHPPRELVPRDVHPFSLVVITVAQGHTVAVLFGLSMYHSAQRSFVQHNISN